MVDTQHFGPTLFHLHAPPLSIAPLNSKINQGKCEHPYQVEDLNSDGQVPSQETQTTDL
jgi:hypothetical protein